MLIRDVLREGREFLKNNNIDERESRLLFAHAMNVDVSNLIRYTECDDRVYKKFLGFLKKRVKGEPFAYIVGEKSFMKLKFLVNKHVLIPREDTEILVATAIERNKKKILDLCTGSGCIAISLAKYIENSVVDASDISARTLNVAKKNALSNGVNVKFIKSDIFKNITNQYEMIVSNPPYIRSDVVSNLQIEVKNEPKRALDGGNNGLYFYNKILKNAKDYLTEDGIIIFEIGYDQADDVTTLANKYGYTRIEKIKDLSNNDRVLVIER